MKRCWPFVFTVLLCGCPDSPDGKPSDDSAEESKKKGKRDKGKGKAKAKGEDAHDWSAAKLRSVKGKAGKMEFTLDVPEGLTAGGGGMMVTYTSDAYRAGDGTDVHLSVHEGNVPPTLDSVAKNSMTLAKNNLVKTKKEMDDGFLVTHHSKDQSHLNTIVWRLPDPSEKGKMKKALACVIKQQGSQPLPSFAALVAQFEKVCLSMKITGGG